MIRISPVALVAVSSTTLRVVGTLGAARVSTEVDLPAEDIATMLFDGTDEREMAGLVGHQTAVAVIEAIALSGAGDVGGIAVHARSAGLIPLGEFDASGDPRGHAVVAGFEALHLGSGLERDLARIALRRWISTLRPDGRLQVYAASLASRPVVIRGGGIPAAFGSALETHIKRRRDLCACEAISWDGTEVSVTGRMDAALDGTGRLAVGEVLTERSWPVGSRCLWEVTGLAPCANLAAVAFDEPEPARETCAGSDWSRGAAFARFQGEAAERFAVGDPPANLLVSDSQSALEGLVADPRELVSYTNEQRERLQIEAYDPDVAEWWTRGCRSDGSSVWLPAALVWTPFPRPRWLAAGIQTTNGAAAAPSVEVASSSAWLELVERDAFLRCWHARKQPDRLVTEHEPCRALTHALRLSGADVHLLRIPAEFGVCVVAAVVVVDGGIRIGCSAGSPLQAAERALVEATMLRRWPVPSVAHACGVRRPVDHAGLWTGPDASERAAWLWQGPAVSLEDMPVAPSWTERAECPDENAAWVLLRSPSPSTVVVRCVSASLLPLSFGYDTDPRAHPRGQDLPWPDGPAEPHPFA